MKTALRKREEDVRAEVRFQAPQDSRASFHFERSRLNNLFLEAIRYPLVLVCAGAGYGKTSAVHDFTQKYEADTAWIQLSERDNVGARFWESYTHTMSQLNEPLARAINKFCFPDTIDKLNQYLILARNHAKLRKQIIVMDDFHLIEDPAVIRFVEHAFLNLAPESTLFLISRSTPRINTASLVSRGHIFNMSEDDLRFTESELTRYFHRLDIPLEPGSLHEIMQDTDGWVFAINLIARSYRKAPAYSGYLRSAMKTNIFRLMETEIWDGISGRLQNFLIRLSLIDHLSVDLIALLAGRDEDLIHEMERQNAYVRRDSYINAYLIHPLFLEFLATKQELLPEEQKRETYAIAGNWCNKNGFKIDALAYFARVGDYEALVSIFFELPIQVPMDIAHYAAGLFSQIPAEEFDRVDFLAVMHIRTIMCLGLWQEAFRLAESYEAKYLRMNENSPIRNHALVGIYYCWGILRTLMCTVEDRYDFDVHYTKLNKYLPNYPIELGQLANHPVGPWVSLVGAARKGAPQEYIDALARAIYHTSYCLSGSMTGADDLARGELKFYQGDIQSAESFIIRSLDQARERKQFDIVHRALFYTLRIAVLQGNYAKMEQTLKEMEALLGENEYTLRFVTYDIAMAWYAYILCLPENIPDWLKNKFMPYGHAYFIENFGNQAKARYCYLTMNFAPLLAYIEEQKQRESILFGRLEMLAMEACIHYKMKNKRKACIVLLAAYETALPNDLVMPFIEMGKDMRNLTAFALKEPSCEIPKPWLESISRKSASYAKRQAHVTTAYKRAKGITDGIAISPRENEILADLAHGLSRAETAVSRNLSVNTVKMIINSLYSKMGAENLPDLIRIATELKMI